MMTPNLPDAFITGYERLTPWADLLDQINVFPVPDGDTGRNLMISLAPLRDVKQKNTAQIMYWIMWRWMIITQSMR